MQFGTITLPKSKILVIVAVDAKLINAKICFLHRLHGIAIPCQKTSTIKSNYEVAIVIPRIWFFGGVQTKAFSFNDGAFSQSPDVTKNSKVLDRTIDA